MVTAGLTWFFSAAAKSRITIARLQMKKRGCRRKGLLLDIQHSASDALIHLEADTAPDQSRTIELLSIEFNAGEYFWRTTVT